MAPAGQGLHSHYIERVRVEQRLVVGQELPFFQTIEDFVRNAFGAHRLRLQFLTEELVAVSPPTLGPVERNVGIDEQPCGIDADSSFACNADRHAAAALVSLVGNGPPYLGNNPLRLPRQPRLADIIAGDNYELVAADAGRKVSALKIPRENL